MAISLSDLKKRLKAATLDKTTLDERFVKTVKDAGRGYQIGGKILSNQIQKRVGEPVRQWAASKGPQNVGRSIRENPTEYIPFSPAFRQQGIQSGQYLLDRTKNPAVRAGISTGQEFIKNYDRGFNNLSRGISQRKPGQALTGAWQSVSPSLAAAGGLVPALSMAGLGGGLGAGVAKLTGADPTTAFGKGANEGFRTRAVTRFTDPVISKAIKITSPSTGLIKRQLAQRGVGAIGNVAEDEIIASFEGYKNKASDRALSLLMGASMAGNIELSKSLKNKISQALSKTGASKKRAVRKVISGIENSGGVQRIVKGTRTFLRNGNRFAGSEKTTSDTIKLKNNVTAQQLGNKIRIRSVAPVSGMVSTQEFDSDIIKKALDTNTSLNNYSASDVKKINEARFLLGNENLQSMQGAVTGVEPYQDEEGNWQVRYNPTKGMIGVAGLMGGQKALGGNVKFSSLLDKKPRFEIDDSGAKVRDLNIKDFPVSAKLGEVLDHPELFKNYPQLKNIYISPKKGLVGGEYIPSMNMIRVPGPISQVSEFDKVLDALTKEGKKLEAQGRLTPEWEARAEMMLDNAKGKDTVEAFRKFDKSILLHEIQHAIQEIEGFARGGSPDMMEALRYRLNSEATQLKFDPEAQEFFIKYDSTLERLLDQGASNKYISSVTKEMEKNAPDVVKKYWKRPNTKGTPYDLYKRLSGELEARAVQRRMDMPMDQRLRTDPYADEAMATTGTTNPNDYITRFEGGTQASVDPSTVYRQDANDVIRSMFKDTEIYEAQKLKRMIGNSKYDSAEEWLDKQDLNSEKRRLYYRVVESMRNFWGEHLEEDEAIEKAFSIPTKANSKAQSVIKVKNADAKVQLDRLLNDGTRLLRMGYTPDQISRIGAKKAREIVDQDIQPKQLDTYHSELDVKTSDIQNKRVQKQSEKIIKDEFDNWERALSKQTGAKKKTIDDRVKSISDMMMDDYNSKKTVKDKVNLLDYVRTPDRVLAKIGLKPESDLIRSQYQAYEKDLPKQLDVVNAWYERTGKSKEASERIFRYLDGEKISLKGEELKVAGEIRKYLDDWADKLGIPKENRIANYITHVFEDAITGKEFDENVEKLIADRVPGSVYDPFLLARQGADGYVKDTFRALDAYVKRASRKYHMDPALERVREASETLDKQSLDYVKSYIDKVNMRPSNIDKMIDNLVKSSPVGYRLGQRPTARVTRSLRNWVYRGTLGLNVGSALRNLTQGVNTYAQLGEKYTGIGYIKAMRDIASGSKELEESGVLGGQFIQDRNISAFKSLSEKLDKGLWVFFDAAERINRGSAYFGAKAKALDAGLSEDQAIQAGIDMARKTQFTFGSIDTPQLLQSDIAKSVLQFQSFNIKQAEMLAEMLKSKEYKKLARYAGAWAVLVYAGGELFGWEWTDAVPFGSDIAQGESRIGKTPTIQGATGILKATVNAPDKYGNTSDEKNPLIRIAQSKDVQDALVAHIPAGVQIKKSIGGLSDVNKGYSETSSGRVRFPIKQNASNYIKAGTLGTWKLKEGQEYFDKNRSVLGEKQSDLFKSSTPAQREAIYNSILDKRDKNDLANSTVFASDNNQIKIPSNQKQFNEFYSDAISKGTGFIDEKRSIEYDPTLTDGEKLEKIQKLQEKMIPWSNALAEMRNGYPEKVFEAEIVTYGKDHPADIKVEDRAKWAVQQLENKSDEEKQKLINRFWESGVLTGRSNGVAQFIEDNYGIDVWTNTSSGSSGKSSSGRSRKIKLGSTPTINTKPIRFTPSQAPQQRIVLRLPQSRGQQTIPVMKATKPSIDLRRVKFG